MVVGNGGLNKDAVRGVVQHRTNAQARLERHHAPHSYNLPQYVQLRADSVVQVKRAGHSLQAVANVLRYVEYSQQPLVELRRVVGTVLAGEQVQVVSGVQR